jgi:CMP-N-acetylneuraminic acid synthetase
MKKAQEVAVVVQARLSSERCPRKMIRPFAGSTLTEVMVRKILSSNVIPKENFYLSVYDPELKEIGHRLGANVFDRSESSALWDGGPTSHIKDMYEWHDKIPFKYVILVSACTPLLEVSTIDNFFNAYLDTDSDGLFAVVEKKNYFWNKEGTLISRWPETEPAMNTKAVEATYEAAHCLYAGRLEKIREGIWMGDFQKPGDIELFPISENEIYDVDYEWQFPIVESIYKTVNKIG